MMNVFSVLITLFVGLAIFIIFLDKMIFNPADLKESFDSDPLKYDPVWEDIRLSGHDVAQSTLAERETIEKANDKNELLKLGAGYNKLSVWIKILKKIDLTASEQKEFLSNSLFNALCRTKKIDKKIFLKYFEKNALWFDYVDDFKLSNIVFGVLASFLPNLTPKEFLKAFCKIHFRIDGFAHPIGDVPSLCRGKPFSHDIRSIFESFDSLENFHTFLDLKNIRAIVWASEVFQSIKKEQVIEAYKLCVRKGALPIILSEMKLILKRKLNSSPEDKSWACREFYKINPEEMFNHGDIFKIHDCPLDIIREFIEAPYICEFDKQIVISQAPPGLTKKELQHFQDIVKDSGFFQETEKYKLKNNL